MGALCAVSFGVADFMASHSSRGIGARNALTGMLLISTVVLSLAAPFFLNPDSLLNMGAAIACIHGAAMAAALLLFFRAMELGPVSVAAPIVASHPIFIVAFALAAGSRPSMTQLAAMLAIVAAVAVVGAGASSKDERNVSRHAVVLAVLASVIYAVAIISAQQAMRWADGFTVLWLGRMFGLLFLVGTFAVSRSRPVLPFAWWPFFVAHGTLDSAGLLFLLLGSIGEFDEITAVVASTFTMVTVGLAWLFHRERISSRRLAAIAVILVSVGILATGN